MNRLGSQRMMANKTNALRKLARMHDEIARAQTANLCQPTLQLIESFQHEYTCLVCSFNVLHRNSRTVISSNTGWHCNGWVVRWNTPQKRQLPQGLSLTHISPLQLPTTLKSSLSTVHSRSCIADHKPWTLNRTSDTLLLSFEISKQSLSVRWNSGR